VIRVGPFRLPPPARRLSVRLSDHGIAYALILIETTCFGACLAKELVDGRSMISTPKSGKGMAFHPRYWGVPTRTVSGDFNYYRWKADCRKKAAQPVKRVAGVLHMPLRR